MRNFALNNLKDVLRNVFYNPGIKRHEISANLRMCAATVSKYTEVLIGRNVVQEEANTKGRNVALSIDPAWHTTLGVDIGGYLVRIGMLRGNGEFQVLEEIPTPADPDLICATVKKYEPDVDAIGIAATAVVDPSLRRIFIFPNMRTWDSFDFSALDLKAVSLTTSGNAAANYEKKFGALRGFSNCMHINIGHGIQAGLFINGTLVTGANHAAGELGHVFSTAEAGKCTCGNVGCLENVVTVPMIVSWIRERMAAGEMRGTLARLCGNDPANVSLSAIRDAYRQSDPQVVSGVKHTAEAVGSALSGIVNVLNPEAISFGGRLFEIFPELVDEIHSAAKLKVLETNSRNLHIIRGRSPLYAACAGAALVPMERFIEFYGIKA